MCRYDPLVWKTSHKGGKKLRKLMLLAAMLGLAMLVAAPAIGQPQYGGNSTTGNVGNNSIVNQCQALQNAINTGSATVTQTGPNQNQYQYNPVNNTSSSALTAPVENTSITAPSTTNVTNVTNQTGNGAPLQDTNTVSASQTPTNSNTPSSAQYAYNPQKGTATLTVSPQQAQYCAQIVANSAAGNVTTTSAAAKPSAGAPSAVTPGAAAPS